MVPDPDLRASDAERESTVARLRDATGDGRLSLDELADRTGAAYAATSRGELEQLERDLPAGDAPAARSDVTVRRRTFFGVLGGDTLSGPLRLGGECRIVNVMGGVDLDLSQATIEDGELTIRIISVMGGSTIHVPDGVHVERTGFSLLGGDDVEPADGPGPPRGAPVIHLKVINVMGGNTVKRDPKRPGRWPWQRLDDHSSTHRLHGG